MIYGQWKSEDMANIRLYTSVPFTAPASIRRLVIQEIRSARALKLGHPFETIGADMQVDNTSTRLPWKSLAFLAPSWTGVSVQSASVIVNLVRGTPVDHEQINGPDLLTLDRSAEDTWRAEVILALGTQVRKPPVRVIGY